MTNTQNVTIFRSQNSFDLFALSLGCSKPIFSISKELLKRKSTIITYTHFAKMFNNYYNY